jgi:hypothetical protein
MVLALGDDADVTADPPLDEALDVDRTRGVTVETVGEGVLELVEMKMLGTSAVGPVEKRTVVFLFRHAGIGGRERTPRR